MSSYTPIASQTLASSASSVTFSSIPTTLNGKTLRDLVLVIDAVTSTTGYMQIRANSDGTGYTIVYMGGNGSSASSGAYSADGFVDYPVFSSSTRTSLRLDFFDFAQTNKHKSVLARSDNASTAVEATAGRWANTAAITSLTMSFAAYGTISAGSTFSLYGIEG